MISSKLTKPQLTLPRLKGKHSMKFVAALHGKMLSLTDQLFFSGMVGRFDERNEEHASRIAGIVPLGWKKFFFWSRSNNVSVSSA